MYIPQTTKVKKIKLKKRKIKKMQVEGKILDLLVYKSTSFDQEIKPKDRP